VRKLSAETEKAVGQINQGIQAVATSIEQQFRDKLEPENIRAEREALQSFSAQLNELGRNYQEMAQRDADVLAQIRESSQTLSAMFMDTMASVQFQDITRQQIEHVIEALNRLEAHAAMLAERLSSFDRPDFAIRTLSSHLDEIYKNLDSHQNALHGSNATSSSSGPRVELF
jgi:methyl-accepting chemotaxis protein